MKFLISEILFPILLFLVARYILRSLFAPKVPDRAGPPPPPRVPEGGELRKDPVCGTYVSTVASLSEKVKGEMVYFCSSECRDKFARTH
jgi:YHS domain-containing protein